jgi:Fic family protein
MPAWPIRFDLRVDRDDPALMRALITAEAYAQGIRGIPIPPAAQFRLDRLNILRAVRGTTGIEGSSLSEEEVGRIIDAKDDTAILPHGREREEREARNAARVMRFVSESLTRDPEEPLTESLICQLHRLTTDGIPYPNNIPGEYRHHAVSAGDYVPPRDGADVRQLMTTFVRWLNGDPVRHWHPIVRAVAAHFYFISIHPFGDGNGRTARAIESFLLYQAHINARGFYSLANFYYRNRTEYIETLDEVRFRSKNSLMPFIRFASDGLVQELKTVYDEIIAEATLVAFRDYARSSLQVAGKQGTPAGERMLHLLDALGREPIELITIRRGPHPLYFLYRGLSSRTLTRDLDFLRDTHLIAIEDGRVRARLDVMEQFKP